MKVIHAWFIGLFCVFTLGCPSKQSFPLVEHWTPNPTIQHIDGTKIHVLSNLAVSSSGKYIHGISFIYCKEEDFSVVIPAPFLTLPTLENQTYTWEKTDSYIEVRTSGDVVALIDISFFDKLNK